MQKVTMQDFEPVSYTHLDVYKRQVEQQDEVLMFYPSVLSDISPCEGETMTSSNLFAHMGAFMPPLRKGEVLHPLEDEAEG